MTPTPPPNTPDGDQPLLPRHRPTLGELVKSSTESELWALDDELDTDGMAPDESPRPQGGVLPVPRQRRVGPKTTAAEGGEEPARNREQIRMNVGKSRTTPQGGGPQRGGGSQLGDLDDLEFWDDSVPEAEVGELPPVNTDVLEPRSVDATSSVGISAPAPSVEMVLPQPEPAAGEPDEFATPQVRAGVKPVPLRPRLGLSGMERLGMGLLAVLLVIAGVYFYVFSVKRLPTESSRAETKDFPIQGGKIIIKSADTYWRVPVTEGADADTVRRGTALLPEIVLTVEGGGALRVMFRNDERQFVGDAVTRSVDGATTLRIPATAGFEDAGMHAAYRTGGTKPWTAEVYEGESVNSPGSAFKLLFEMNISTDRR